MPGTGWPLVSRHYKEFNVSECEERACSNHSGVQCGPFMWDMSATDSALHFPQGA